MHPCASAHNLSRPEQPRAPYRRTSKQPLVSLKLVQIKAPSPRAVEVHLRAARTRISYGQTTDPFCPYMMTRGWPTATEKEIPQIRPALLAESAKHPQTPQAT